MSLHMPADDSARCLAETSFGTQKPSCLSVVRSGIGLATDVYDLTIMNVIRPQLEAAHGTLTPEMNGAVTAATCAGSPQDLLKFGFFEDFGKFRKNILMFLAFLVNKGHVALV